MKLLFAITEGNHYNNDMIVGKRILLHFKEKITKENAAKYANVVADPKYRPHLDIPYIDDDNFYHKFDLYFPVNPSKKKILVIDIHGGSYMFGNRKENYIFGTVFLDAGFYFIATDYIASDGTRPMRALFDESVLCVKYIVTHLKELGIPEDVNIFITGDSAGGHIALHVSEVFQDKEYAHQLGHDDLPDINLKGVLINCTVFNYVPLGKWMISRKGRRYMYGTDGTNKAKRKALCPRVHIASLKVPLFASTCRNDFLRKGQSLVLKKTMANRPNKFVFVDLDIKDKSVSHVHNILDITQPASIQINKEMVNFIQQNAE